MRLAPVPTLPLRRGAAPEPQDLRAVRPEALVARRKQSRNVSSQPSIAPSGLATRQQPMKGSARDSEAVRDRYPTPYFHAVHNLNGNPAYGPRFRVRGEHLLAALDAPELGGLL